MWTNCTRGTVLTVVLASVACGDGAPAAVGAQAGTGASQDGEAAVGSGTTRLTRALDGVWQMGEPDSDCELFLTLEAGYYGFDRICKLGRWGYGDGDSPGYGIEAEGGAFTLGDGTITFVREYASCESGKPETETLPYDVLSSGSLRLVTSELAMVMDRTSRHSMAEEGVRTSFGCWYGRFFAPGELTQH